MRNTEVNKDCKLNNRNKNNRKCDTLFNNRNDNKDCNNRNCIYNLKVNCRDVYKVVCTSGFTDEKSDRKSVV